ncbi:uncharacterized protein METZ01_LOCUS369847, partial [marine metagenome]
HGRRLQRRGVGPHSRRQPEGDILLRPGRRRPHERSRQWHHHQYELPGGEERWSGSRPSVRGGQGWRPHPHHHPGTGPGSPRHSRQRHCARNNRHPDDARPVSRPRRARPADPPRRERHARGRRPLCPVPGLGGGPAHHRRNHRRQRRSVHGL